MDNEWLAIRPAHDADFAFLKAADAHITAAMLHTKIAAGEVLVAVTSDEHIGLLRWGWFWDNTPFMNLLFVAESWRGRGVATQLIARWETDMRATGVDFVLTSTLSDESAQHLYRKRGYRDIGGFVLPDEALELILFKPLHP